MNEQEYEEGIDNAQKSEDEEDDGVYQDNEEGTEEEMEERLRQANGEQNNVYITAVDVSNQDDEIFRMYTREEIDNFKCIFDMFDSEKSGFVDT
jgi:hypothetical protein